MRRRCDGCVPTWSVTSIVTSTLGASPTANRNQNFCDNFGQKQIMWILVVLACGEDGPHPWSRMVVSYEVLPSVAEVRGFLQARHLFPIRTQTSSCKKRHYGHRGCHRHHSGHPCAPAASVLDLGRARTQMAGQRAHLVSRRFFSREHIEVAEKRVTSVMEAVSSKSAGISLNPMSPYYDFGSAASHGTSAGKGGFWLHNRFSSGATRQAGCGQRWRVTLGLAKHLGNCPSLLTLLRRSSDTPPTRRVPLYHFPPIMPLRPPSDVPRPL